MSFNLSNIGEARLATCHPKLQRIVRKILETYDLTVLCGYRGEDEQTEAVRTGRSRKPWPTSKHNVKPSRAIDLAPYPVEWPEHARSEKDRALRLARFAHFAGFVLGTADAMGIRLRWLGDPNRDGDLSDGFEMPHFELAEGEE